MFDQIETLILGGLQSIFDQFGWWGVAGLMLFENATNITPSEIILGLAGWLLLANHETSPLWALWGGAIAALASALGASLMYWAARLGGRPLVDRAARWIRLDPAHIVRAEQQFQRWGGRLVFFGRMVPGIRTLVNIPAGLAHMPYPRFLAATLAGAYIWCTLLIGLGYFFGHEWEVISSIFRQYALWIGMGVLLAGAVWMFLRRKPGRLQPDEA